MSFTSKVLGRYLAALAALAGIAGVVACSSDDVAAPASSTASAVAGEADTHCAATVVTVESAACTEAVEHDHGDDDAADAGDAGADAAAEDDTASGTNGDYGPTRFNAESDDDDCKYHVSWRSTAIAENSNVSFIATVTNKADGTAVKGANPRLELFLDDRHPGPNVAGTKAVESPAGTYTIGPVRFDAPGRWTVRFHFFETCNDNEHSPHGHAAFFATVP